MRRLWIALAHVVLAHGEKVAAQFSPDGGLPGSTAIHRDSVAFEAWAEGVTFGAGPLDIARPGLGTVNVDTFRRVLGAADGATVSLGDGGTATLTFGGAIANGPGVDFVVFENGFGVGDGTVFAELAFVEASSDGATFVRFPSTSLTAQPVGSFGTLRPELIDGLAGKFSAPYGVGFDLSDLPATTGFDASRVTHVRLRDVIGTADAAFAKTDSEGSIVLDPYPTPFASGGFDLDAVGVVHGLVSPTKDLAAEPRDRKRLTTVVAAPGAYLADERWARLAVWIDAGGQNTNANRTAPEVAGLYVGLSATGEPLGFVIVQ